MQVKIDSCECLSVFFSFFSILLWVSVGGRERARTFRRAWGPVSQPGIVRTCLDYSRYFCNNSSSIFRAQEQQYLYEIRYTSVCIQTKKHKKRVIRFRSAPYRTVSRRLRPRNRLCLRFSESTVKCRSLLIAHFTDWETGRLPNLQFGCVLNLLRLTVSDL